MKLFFSSVAEVGDPGSGDWLGPVTPAIHLPEWMRPYREIQIPDLRGDRQEC